MKALRRVRKLCWKIFHVEKKRGAALVRSLGSKGLSDEEKEGL